MCMYLLVSYIYIFVYICLYVCIYVCMCMYVYVSLLDAIKTPYLIIFVRSLGASVGDTDSYDDGDKCHVWTPTLSKAFYSSFSLLLLWKFTPLKPPGGQDFCWNLELPPRYACKHIHANISYTENVRDLQQKIRDVQQNVRTRDFELECSISAPVRSSVHRNGTYPTLKTFLRFFNLSEFRGRRSSGRLRKHGLDLYNFLS